ncbi:helix-turn-helix domain-containing protein [Streptomyces djakartensis]|uniref:helix-turn-helix domain-containing protein n=1 Tax=Streptomyces djakartensis TaxID=68193 RepID=UPI00167E5537|nr:helix-turn-helix transcriptional regulator [Streptomyces djakartensis]
MSEGTAAADFAALLGELKERSGLSYGVLAKRLHMSTSTLHRYCNGDAVPTDYAPVERLARLCRASPEELVELHRRWVLADADRGRKGAVAPVPEVVPEAEAASEAGRSEGLEVGAPGEAPGHRARRPLLAGVAVAVVLGGVGLAVAVPSGGGDDAGRGGSAAVSGGGSRPDGRSAASVSPSGSPSARTGKDKVRDRAKGEGEGRRKAAPSKAPASSAPAAGTGPGTDRPGRDTAGAPGPAPLTVNTSPHAWESPCSQRYLVNRPPGQVGPPPLEQDAPAWVAATGAVPSGEQYLKLTVQGTGKKTVVIDGLTVRMAGKRAPLAWNDYAMGYPGVGCGGGVPTRFFTVALDAARPAVVPEAGHRDFPFKVSESDPEVYHIRADASAYDVSWYLELSWSSGSRKGTLTVDDRGRPFRTSGNNGRPAYEFPLGGEKWVEAGTTG